MRGQKMISSTEWTRLSVASRSLWCSRLPPSPYPPFICPLIPDVRRGHPHNGPHAATLPNSVAPASPGDCYETKRTLLLCIHWGLCVSISFFKKKLKFVFPFFSLFLFLKPFLLSYDPGNVLGPGNTETNQSKFHPSWSLWSSERADTVLIMAKSQTAGVNSGLCLLPAGWPWASYFLWASVPPSVN